MARNFPTGPQDQYFYQPGQPYQGLMYAHDPRRDYLLTGYIRDVAPISQSDDLTVTYGADGDVIGYTFDGVTITAEALTDDNTSAAALRTAVDAYITANPDGPLASTGLAANVLTVAFSDALPHTVAGFDSGTSDVVAAPNTAAESYAQLQYGLGVTLDPTGDFSVNGPNLRSITAAINAASELLGVVALFPGEMNSRFTVEALGFDPDFLLPSKGYPTVSRGRVIVPWVGTLPTSPAAEVYWINDPASEADRGKFRGDATGAVLVNATVEGVYADANLVCLFLDL